MPINAGYEYLNAEKAYLAAQTMEEKIICLEEMIKTAPKHKGSENLLAGLKTRLKKFREQQEKSKKSGKTSRKTIKKEGFQCVLVGLPNSGKSSLLAQLTNARPKIDSHPFSTIEPEIGTLDFDGVKAQVIDMPSIGSEAFDSGIVNTADCIVLVITSLSEISQIEPSIKRATGEKIIVINKSDLLDDIALRKMQDTVLSKRISGLLVSSLTGFGIRELKGKIISTMQIIRVYTKEPGKSPSRIPVVLPLNSTVKDVAETILKGFSHKVRETRLTGPSSKFSNQKVGLAHVLKDKDIVEFHTR